MPALSQMVLEAAGMLQEQDLTVNAAGRLRQRGAVPSMLSCAVGSRGDSCS